MYMPANRIVGLGIYRGYCMLQRQILTELVFGGGEVCTYSLNLRNTFATRLLSSGAGITDVQHLLDHASVKTTEKAYAAFGKNERFRQTIDLLDKLVVPRLRIVR